MFERLEGGESAINLANFDTIGSTFIAGSKVTNMTFSQVPRRTRTTVAPQSSACSTASSLASLRSQFTPRSRWERKSTLFSWINQSILNLPGHDRIEGVLWEYLGPFLGINQEPFDHKALEFQVLVLTYLGSKWPRCALGVLDFTWSSQERSSSVVIKLAKKTEWHLHRLKFRLWSSESHRNIWIVRSKFENALLVVLDNDEYDEWGGDGRLERIMARILETASACHNTSRNNGSRWKDCFPFYMKSN